MFSIMLCVFLFFFLVSALQWDWFWQRASPADSSELGRGHHRGKRCQDKGAERGRTESRLVGTPPWCSETSVGLETNCLKCLRFHALEHADHHQVVPGVLSTFHGQSRPGGRKTRACHWMYKSYPGAGVRGEFTSLRAATSLSILYTVVCSRSVISVYAWIKWVS